MRSSPTRRGSTPTHFWRPVTAIRWPDDGNPETASDPIWRPFLVTPPYPDYPCALPTAAGAAAEALRQFFGTDDVAFTRTFNAPAVPLPAPMRRCRPSRSPAASRRCPPRRRSAEMRACMPGSTSAKDVRPVRAKARRVARFVVQHSLQPAKGR